MAKNRDHKTKIAILGAGSWGTAVAIHLANCGNQVMLWGHDSQHVSVMKQQNMNMKYLPSITFPDLLEPTTDLAQCIKQASVIIIAVPSHAFANLLAQINKPIHGLAWLTKGLDPTSHCFLSELVARRWGISYPIAIISGPSFAGEVAKYLPTALTLTGNNLSFQTLIQTCLHQKNVRIYLSNDVIGVQFCGAVKNILAIACGISDGLGYGANAQAALITRGLAEMIRLGKLLGGSEESFIGLAGLGDLALTCTNNQSRNRRFGLYLGRGMNAIEAEKQIGQVIEGKHNVAEIGILARRYHVEMPICAQVEALLNGQITPQDAVINLMNRAAREE